MIEEQGLTVRLPQALVETLRPQAQAKGMALEAFVLHSLSGLSTRNPVLTVGDLVINRLARTARRGEQKIELAPKEFDVLVFLMANTGKAVSREDISQAVWHKAFDNLTNCVDVYINHLRIKIEFGDLPPLIHTVRLVGYAMYPERSIAQSTGL